MPLRTFVPFPPDVAPAFVAVRARALAPSSPLAPGPAGSRGPPPRRAVSQGARRMGEKEREDSTHG